MNKIIFLGLIIILTSCNNHSNNTDKKALTEKTITPQKIIVDSTKLVFDDIEFGMSIDRLKKTKVFKNGISDFDVLFSEANSEDSGLTFLTWYSYTLNEKLRSKNFFDYDSANSDFDVESKILNYIDKHIKTGGKKYVIGNKEFKIGFYLFDNKLYNFFICIHNDDELSYIKDVICEKYGNPTENKKIEPIYKKKYLKLAKKTHQKEKATVASIEGYLNSIKPISNISTNIYLKFPSTYCLYEWKTENKTLRIYNTFTLYNGWSNGYYENYYLEIYDEKTIDAILRKVVAYKEEIINSTANSNKKAIESAAKII